VAEAELKLNQTNLAKAKITSPINGVVLKRNVDPGQTVASSLQAPVLFSIAEDLRQMEVQVDVDEADVGKVGEGQEATFFVDAYAERRFSARIRELRYGSEVVQGVVTYKAVLSTDNAELLLRPGMTATAELAVQHVERALLIPNAALRFSPPTQSESDKSGGLLQKLLPGRPQFRPASRREEAGPDRTVWVLRDGQLSATTIRIGASDGKRTEVLKGDLAEGQAVVTDAVTTRR
jgi:HlyD family secretion protein